MSQFRNLVFEGGGVKGIAYAGAVAVLEDKKILRDIQRVAGTSAGAITAALLALGATNRRIQEIVGGTDFREFMDDSWGVLRDINRLVKKYGWYKGDKFEEWMKRHVSDLTEGRADMTFGQLAELAGGGESGAYRYRELWMVTSDLSMQLPRVFSAETTPGVSIWQAVRMSMSIPLFFASVNYEGHVMVDGGVTWNYPVDLFDDLKYMREGDESAFSDVDYPTTRSNSQIYNKQTLGLRVATSDEIKAQNDRVAASEGRTAVEIKNLKDYTGAMLEFILESANNSHLHENDWHRTVFIEADGVKFTDFNLPDSKVRQLVDSGRACTEKYFRWFDNSPEDCIPINKID